MRPTRILAAVVLTAAVAAAGFYLAVSTATHPSAGSQPPATASPVSSAATGTPRSGAGPDLPPSTSTINSSGDQPTPGRCAASALQGSVQGQEGAAGTIYTTIGLRNVSAKTCTVKGIPQVRLLGAQGQPATAPSVPSGPAGSVVVLRPGKVARFTFSQPNACDARVAGCGDVVRHLLERPCPGPGGIERADHPHRAPGRPDHRSPGGRRPAGRRLAGGRSSGRPQADQRGRHRPVVQRVPTRPPAGGRAVPAGRPGRVRVLLPAGQACRAVGLRGGRRLGRLRSPRRRVRRLKGGPVAAGGRFPQGIEDRHEPTQDDLQPPGGEPQGAPVPDGAEDGLGPVAVAGEPGDLEQVLGEVAGILLELVLGPFAGDALPPDHLEPGRGDGRLRCWLVHALPRVPKPLDQ